MTSHTSMITQFDETAWTENRFEPIVSYTRTVYRLHQVRDDGAICTKTYLNNLQAEMASARFQSLSDAP